MRRLAPLGLIMLGGCLSIISVQADGGKPQISVIPFGLMVSRGSADAIAVKQLSVGVGITFACGPTVGIGINYRLCMSVDPASCGVAVMSSEPVTKPEIDRIRRIATKAVDICKHDKENSK